MPSGADALLIAKAPARIVIVLAAVTVSSA
jgi:hypothetical protein